MLTTNTVNTNILQCFINIILFTIYDIDISIIIIYNIQYYKNLIYYNN